MIPHENLIDLLKELTDLPQECEWVEFKVNKEIVENIGAISSDATIAIKHYNIIYKN